MYFTDHFNPDVDALLACPCPDCGSICDYDPEYLDNMELLRVSCGFGFPVNSGCRCRKHNYDVSKSSFGEHIAEGRQCTAMDIGITDRYKRRKILKVIFSTPRLDEYFKDIYSTPEFIHIARGRTEKGLGVKG